MRPSTRSALVAVAAAAVALAVVAVPVLLRSDDDPEPSPSPTPVPGITATAVEVTSAPQVASELRGRATEEIGAALVTLYERAFTVPDAVEDAETEPDGPDPSPTPTPPSARLAASMTTIARRALAASPGVFDEAADIHVHSGTVRFEGVITFDGKDPLEALLEVNFLGEGAPLGSRSPLVRLQQKGTLVLRNTDSGWLVDGFDLRLQTAPAPTPSPEED